MAGATLTVDGIALAHAVEGERCLCEEALHVSTVTPVAVFPFKGTRSDRRVAVVVGETQLDLEEVNLFIGLSLVLWYLFLQGGTEWFLN